MLPKGYFPRILHRTLLHPDTPGGGVFHHAGGRAAGGEVPDPPRGDDLQEGKDRHRTEDLHPGRAGRHHHPGRRLYHGVRGKFLREDVRLTVLYCSMNNLVDSKAPDGRNLIRTRADKAVVSAAGVHADLANTNPHELDTKRRSSIPPGPTSCWSIPASLATSAASASRISNMSMWLSPIRESRRSTEPYSKA